MRPAIEPVPVPRPRDAGAPRPLLRVAVAAVALALLPAGPPVIPAAARQSSAVREFVLKQIQVPHHYYYREMYLPQVTDGPASAAWSPDGMELIYAMQGSLWRQGVGSTVARQITDGPGYHHQPDWSPDGHHVVFAAYLDDAIEVWILDLRTGVTRPLTQERAVSVEPRFSPDGTRLAFVSTRFEGRFHVFTGAFKDGVLTGVERLTEDRDSGLPRYYYSRYDHYLSPSWSPDGGEILLVSNRGRIWGTGGFFRMAARAGAKLREVHREETTWKARPDWARDGRRVAYASYLGGQWHQIWLGTAEGGDPFPLTYGEFDATSPRWSPDGRRIAYISNQDGGTSLWTIEIPGGRRHRMRIETRRRLKPSGRLKIQVVDAATGRPVPARVAVETPDGRSWAPDDAWRHGDEAFDRGARTFEYSYFHTPGTSEVVVPAGSATVEVIRGLEYRPFRREVEVAEGAVRSLRVPLRRLADLPARGWWSGDLHVHMNYGGSYRNTPERLAAQAAAEDLQVVENLVVNKEQRIPDIAWFAEGPAPPLRRGALVAHGQEFHTSFWGHTALLGQEENLLLPDYAAYANTAAASLYPHNPAVFDLAHEQRGIVGYVHPFDAVPDPVKDERLTHDLPVGAALDKLDYFEVVGFSDHLATATVWHRLLNCGFRIPAGAGTDAMANYASLRGPVGVDRVYVRTGARPDHAAWLRGLRDGRTFATNGPLLGFALGGREPGDEMRLPAGGGTLDARVWLRSIVPIERLEIVGNGEVVATLPLDDEGRAAEALHRVAVRDSGWYVLRAWSPRPHHPILDIYPYATTSPIYVSVGGRPVRSAADAAYFLKWIDRLEQAARAHADWNTEAEKGAVLRDLEAARAVFRERGAAPDAPGARPGGSPQ
ncbi:MAG: CehA/McbA family metallohydrolase [Candidatus Polarisedimenticolia bacterium]